MRKLLLVLVLLFAITLCGCLSDWVPGVTPDEPEPVVPEVVVNAILEAEDWEVDWSIENISESHIYDYSLTFTIAYADVKTTWEESVSGVNLFPTDIDFGTLELPLVEGMFPESLVYVLVTY